MGTSYRSDDDEDGGAESKLLPDWSVAADDQVVFAGLAAVAVLAVLLGWSAWRSGGDEDAPEPPAPAAGEASDVAAEEFGEEVAEEVSVTTVGESTTAFTAAVGDVQAALDPIPGDITGRVQGTVAVLNGFVANDAESREAENAAAAVEGITSVENNLVLLEPAVVSALEDAGVTGATAIGRGTAIAVSGTVDSEVDRLPALTAAAAVPGVTEIIDDRLNVGVTAELNALPQVRFATASADILPASLADLDAAADLLAAAGDIRIEIQGYTDSVGPADGNLRLSQARAEAVRTYLIDAGVDPGVLSATGLGETGQFGVDLAANRVVRFQQIDG